MEPPWCECYQTKRKACNLSNRKYLKSNIPNFRTVSLEMRDCKVTMKIFRRQYRRRKLKTSLWIIFAAFIKWFHITPESNIFPTNKMVASIPPPYGIQQGCMKTSSV